MPTTETDAEDPSRRATSRYLELVKRAVLDELYIEHELRIEYLLEQLAKGAPADPERLRDPMRTMRVRADRLLAERRSGHHADADSTARFLPLALGRSRLDHLEADLDEIRTNDVPGDLVVCGAGRGGTAIFVRAYLDAYDMHDRAMWIVDEFQPPPSGPADLNAIRDAMDRFELLDDQVRFLQGPYDSALATAPIPHIAGLVVAASRDDVRAILDALYARVSPGGFVLIDAMELVEARGWLGGIQAAGEPPPLIERVDGRAVSWRKQVASESPPDELTDLTAERSQDLSVVVVFYNMRREAARTLHSLSRSYQRGVDDLDYEVIVVENGSAPDQRLGERYVQSFGREFRYVDMGDGASSSPVGALNHGIELAQGRALALMIDGAHVLTPGVLRFGMLGLRTYAPAIVGTQQWYVGPGQQPDTLLAGYDQAYEDHLFEDIAWPTDGYRLFDIGQFIGDRDWFDGLWESNCLFVPRPLIDQAGAFDGSFSMPGGGYANLELYERLGSTPNVTSVTILGEGSFHQAHGGTTTNQPEVDMRHGELAAYSEHFVDLRGKAYRGHGKPTHYVGSMRPNTMRSRSRRRTAANFFKPKDPTGADGLPTKPVPMPQDLKTDFVEAFWNSLAWKQASWLGWKTQKAPPDLFVYQELIHRLRPDWIVETGPGSGGRTLFLASMCDLIDHGSVLCIDPKGATDRPEHSRITYVQGVAHDPATARRVMTLVGAEPHVAEPHVAEPHVAEPHVAEPHVAEPHALVILGTRGSRQRVVAEFELYAPFVQVDSYVIIEDTIVNGHPVWPGFGAGPMEAVKGVVNERASFASDHDLEKYGLTFNPSGYLKRVR